MLFICSNNMDMYSYWYCFSVLSKKQGKSEGFDSCDRPSNLTQIGFKSSIFQPELPWNLMDDPEKKSGTSPMLFLSFLYHFVAIGEFKLELQSGNSKFGSNSMIFLAVRPWNTIGHLFFLYPISSCVYHFIPIGEFKLELQSGNAQFGSKSTIFFSRVTFKLDSWPWKTIGQLFYVTSSFVHHFVPIGEFKLELQSGNAQFGSKSTIFLAVWPRKFTDDPEKQ